MIPSAMPTPPRPPRAYAEFSLGFVLARSAVEHGEGGGTRARLDAVESTLAQLMRRWRGAGRLSAARDIRIAPRTLEALLAWIGAAEGDAGDAGLLERLGVYHSGAVADREVPRGWIRVYLGGARTGPGGVRVRRG